MNVSQHAATGVEAPVASGVPIGRGAGTGATVQSGIAILCLGLMAVPLVPVLIQAFIDRPIYDRAASFTFDNFAHLLALDELRTMLWATLLFGVLSIAFSMVFGVVLSILLGRTNIPFRNVLFTVLLWPLFISPLIMAFGAIVAYGPSGFVTSFVAGLLGIEQPWHLYTVTGISVISGVTMVPMTMLYCMNAAQQQDPSHEAAARVVGAGPIRILSRVTLPMMRPALLFALVMNVVSMLEMLAIPLILGSPVNIELFTTFIYDKGFESGTPDYGLVSAAAIVIMTIVGLMIAFQNRMLRESHRFVSIGSRAAAFRRLDLGAWRWISFALVAAYLVLAIGVVLGGVLIRALTEVFSPFVSPLDVLTLDNFHEVVRNEVYRRSIMNTLVIAIGTGLLGTAIVAAVALVVNRSAFAFRRGLGIIAQVPRAVPGMMVGLGVFYASLFVPGLGSWRNTIWLVLIAFLIRYLPAGYGIITPALLQISSDFDRAGRVAGADWLTIVRRLVLPVAKPALLSCFILLAILAIKDYATAIFLLAPGSEIMGSTMLSLWVQGDTGPVAALAVIQVALTTAVVLLARRLFGVQLHG
jgi:iron(III) transport system permease protein